MHVAEILQELPLLSPTDRDLIRNRLNELESDEETPEMLRAIDEGLESLRQGKTHTIEEARLLVMQWTTKLS